jgi:RNA polymerase sigma factor (sigma-70 family)
MGTSDAAVLDRPDVSQGPSDHQLVSAVRRGDDRAFEALYSRYQRRIAGYVYGMVKDYGRAEDITQEVFVSALRRMRETERPIAFKPWIYEIAKNACIDAYRRGRRAEEVSLDADDRLSASDHGRLVATGPGPDAAIDTQQDLDHLCGAFGGLSETHHQILVMRELEGLSYKDIGDRMGMSRAAVESTLFRARKRLGEEYDELASGARCLRIQAIIADADAGGSRLGVRDQRRLARHVSHCQPCRRLAAHAGLDIALPVRTRVAGKLAAWLPLPAFLRLRREGGETVAATGGSGGGHGWATHLPAFAEPLQSGWGKAMAGLAAVLVAGAGAGVTTTLRDHSSDTRDAGGRPAAERSVDGGDTATPARIGGGGAARDRTASGNGSRSTGTVRRRGDGAARRAGSGSESLGAGKSGGARTTAPATASHPGDTPAQAGAGGDRRSGGDQQDSGPRLPKVKSPAELPKTPDLPAAGSGQQKLQEATDNVGDTVQNAGNNVGDTVDKTLDNAQTILDEPQNLLPNVGNTANDAVAGAGNTVNGALNDVGKTVGDLLKPKPNG